MDHGGTDLRAGVLRRWPRTRVSRQIDRLAQALRVATEVVSTRDGRLLDQRHGRTAILLCEPGGGPWLDSGHAEGFGAVGESPPDGKPGTPAADGCGPASAARDAGV